MTSLPIANPIATSANSCLAAFHELLCNHAIKETEKIERQLARFNFWAANIGVFAPSRASLDTRLSSRGGIKYRPLILQLLSVLEKNLHTAFRAEPSETIEDRNADAEDVSYVDSLQAVQDLIDRLHRLSALIRKSAVRDRSSRAANFVERDEDGNDLSAEFESNAFRIIQQLYPDASETLCRQLGASVSFRRKRVLYSRRHQVKLATKVPVPDQTIVAPVPLLPRATGTPSDHDASTGIGTLPEEPVIDVDVNPSETAASVLESDIQSTIAPSRASSASTGSMLQDGRLKYPRAPKINESMGEASCPYCSAIMTDEELSNPKLWRRHVKKDIEPYICVAESCKSQHTCFDHFKRWVTHIQQEHRIQWHCSLLVHPPIAFEKKEDFEQHMLEVHKGKFNPSRISSLAKIASRPAFRLFDECPLCKAGSEDVVSAEGLPSRSNNPDRLPRHVAGHLKSLALMFLPPGNDDTEDETGSETSSSTKRSDRTVNSKNSIFQDSLSFEGHEGAHPPWEPGVEADEDWQRVSKREAFDPEIDPTLNTFLRARLRQRQSDSSQRIEEPTTLSIEERLIWGPSTDEMIAEVEKLRRIQIDKLRSKLFLLPGMGRVQLNLDHPGRELILRGDLLRAGLNRFTWLETHVILFDNFLILAKIVSTSRDATFKKGEYEEETYNVSKLPIPIQLLVLESNNDEPILRSSNKGLGVFTPITKDSATAQDPRVNPSITNTRESHNPLQYTRSNNLVPSNLEYDEMVNPHGSQGGAAEAEADGPTAKRAAQEKAAWEMKLEEEEEEEEKAAGSEALEMVKKQIEAEKKQTRNQLSSLPMPEHPGHDTDRESQETSTAGGRPRNKWTPSRQRKLARLYTLTSLTTDEIQHVLGDEGSNPRNGASDRALPTPSSIQIAASNTGTFAPAEQAAVSGKEKAGQGAEHDEEWARELREEFKVLFRTKRLDNAADAPTLYPFRVKHLGKVDTHTLYASSAQNRQEWCNKILEAKTRHAISLSDEKSEPFRLRVMADSAFSYGAAASAPQLTMIPGSLKGTPLDRAIREIEQEQGSSTQFQPPICRAEVNCSATFVYHTQTMVLIATDDGVYISDAVNSRRWKRLLQISRVTQIAILEEFSYCLVLTDKSLVAYHLDTVIRDFLDVKPQSELRRGPQKLSKHEEVSFFAIGRMKERTLVFYKTQEGLHSIFKVLEPIFLKPPEKKSRFAFGRKEGTDFFREFDEFYIPADCFTIDLFNTSISIGTLKGFELLTLNKKVTIRIPDLTNLDMGNIAARLENQKPLGMFRLSDSEFLLCYEECSLYVDKHGDLSRSVMMEYIGKAKTATLYGAYLVLFQSDFVEIRNAENGTLKQIIAGRDIRSLDYGINPLATRDGLLETVDPGKPRVEAAMAGAGTVTPQSSSTGNSAQKGTIKLAMAHPEVAESWIVLEMVLNEEHRKGMEAFQQLMQPSRGAPARGRDGRQRDPMDYGPATMEMLWKDAMTRDFLPDDVETA